jgi:hypothetical protein
MNEVFRNSIQTAAEEGIAPLLSVCSRELLSLPFNILREFWHEVHKEDGKMQSANIFPVRQGSWRESFLAGLPHLLIAVFIGITGVNANTRLTTVSGIVLMFLFALGLFITIYDTWRSQWPAWSASWYGCIGLIVFILVILPYQDFNPPLRGFIVGAGIFVLLPLSLITLLYWLSRRNPIEGLLMAQPLIILYWIPVLEFIPNHIRSWLIFDMFLLSALTAMTIVRINNIRKAVWMVLGASVVIGLPIAYARTYWHNIPAGHFLAPSIDQMVGMFSIQFLAGAALAIGPVVGWGIWTRGKNHGWVGRVSAGFILMGALVNLFGHFSYWWWYSRNLFLNIFQISAVYKPNGEVSTFLIYAGLTLLMAGVIWLTALIWKKNKLLSIPMVISPLALPLLAVFPVYLGYQISPTVFPFPYIQLHTELIDLIFLAGLTWIALSGWAIGRLYSNPVHLEGVA